MKYIHTHFKLLLLFGVFAVFAGCEKDEPYDPSKEMDDYFEGKVNGVEFEIAADWPCPRLNGTYYPGGYLTFQSGYFSVIYSNCNTGEHVVIGTRENLHEGVFTSCDSADTVGPRGEYSNVYASVPGDSSVWLRAKECIDIRLEILRLVERSATDGYIEGTLEAIARDPELDTTIVISDVKFGYKY